MLRFNRKTEYALIAMRHMASRSEGGALVSARELAQAYRIPHPVLSKVLQRLQTRGLVESVQGTKGGYRIVKPLSEITVAELVEAFEGPIAVTDCVSSSLCCTLNEVCNVKSLFQTLNKKIESMLQEITLHDLRKDTLGLAGNEATQASTRGIL